MSEPTPDAKPPASAEPAEGGALWAVLVGGAILAIAALLIFWPAGDAATRAGGPGGRDGAGQQANLSAAGGPGGAGVAGGLGVGARESDPAQYRGNARVNPGILPVGQAGVSMAPPRPPKPEPTSFDSASAEIAYFEKKPKEARLDLEQRTLFRERMKRNIENAASPKARDAAEGRAKIVEKNYELAKKAYDDLKVKVDGLKEKQRQTGNP